MIMNVMSTNLMDFVFDRLFSSSKSKDMSLMKMNRTQNNLLGEWTNISQQIPADIHQMLVENGLISPFVSSVDSVPESAILNTNYRRILNKNVAPFASSSFNSPIISQFLMNCFRQLYSYPDIFLDPTCYLTPEFRDSYCENPTKPDTKMSSNENITCDVTLKTSGSAPLIQLHSTVESSDNVPQVDDLAKHQDKLVKYACKNSAHVYSLELSNRKTKELQKRSKKRRRRQKKIQAKASCPLLENLPTSCSKKVDADSRATSKLPRSPLETMDFFHDIFSNANLCEGSTQFSTVDSSNSVHILLPGVASLLISVESFSDEDADWDELGCSDWISTAEFESSGLFMPNLTVSKCSSSQVKFTAPEDAVGSAESAELKKMRELLEAANQSWNEAMKDTCQLPKVSTKVTFAEDINLVEVCPVEICDRKGEWELYALERIRFKRRIDEIEKILSPCLKTEHRENIYQKLYPIDL